jgi:hypothetical protein
MGSAAADHLQSKVDRVSLDPAPDESADQQFDRDNDCAEGADQSESSEPDWVH